MKYYFTNVANNDEWLDDRNWSLIKPEKGNVFEPCGIPPDGAEIEIDERLVNRCVVMRDGLCVTSIAITNSPEQEWGIRLSMKGKILYAIHILRIKLALLILPKGVDIHE